MWLKQACRGRRPQSLVGHGRRWPGRRPAVGLGEAWPTTAVAHETCAFVLLWRPERAHRVRRKYGRLRIIGVVWPLPLLIVR
jgi:hypothetical protein